MASLLESTHVSLEEHSDARDSTGDSDDESNDGASESEQAEDSEKTNPNAGWADAMAKILSKKTLEDKPSILAKNKDLDKVKEKEKKERLERKKQLDKKRAWEMLCREKPDVVRDRETERNLQRIATRGVVQLFNAVRKHQKHIDDKMTEVGGSERKRAKLLSAVSKKDFIDVLRGAEPGAVPASQKQVAAVKPEEKPSWSILRDDFMMGASMKDWDKESEEEGGKGDQEGVRKGSVDYNSESD
ncbi:RRP15-like protein [Paramormyrops kingsleyae]